MMVFHGGRFQRGYGLGSFFKSLARKAFPFLQKGAKSIGRAAVNTGMNIAQDVLAGNNLKDSAQARLQQTANNLKRQAINRIIPQSGSGAKRLKRKAPQKKLISPRTGNAKRAKKAPQKKQAPQRKRRAPQTVGVIKRIKVGSKKDIFGD